MEVAGVSPGVESVCGTHEPGIPEVDCVRTVRRTNILSRAPPLADGMGPGGHAPAAFVTVTHDIDPVG
jgi:hypothetical protein